MDLPIIANKRKLTIKEEIKERKRNESNEIYKECLKIEPIKENNDRREKKRRESIKRKKRIVQTKWKQNLQINRLRKEISRKKTERS
jgi:hypothetical protein